MADDKYLDVVEVFKGEDRQYYYRGKSNNGETLFTSEGFTMPSTALRAAQKIIADEDNENITLKLKFQDQ